MFWPGQDRTVDCAVLDISGGGARILVSEGVVLPDIVELAIDQWPGPPHTCKVAWRAGAQLGLEFGIMEPDEAPPASADSPNA